MAAGHEALTLNHAWQVPSGPIAAALISPFAP